jgi:UDP-N-acetylglucosamine--N-acetylmuramyl-(pentapeptide) pyrophosphoryl-undecaprenol N-acetylglucosamine transferase
LLSSKVQAICVAYDGMEKFFPASKILPTGNPIRQDITTYTGSKAEALGTFSLSEGPVTLLVVGGSLGARTINKSIHAGLETLIQNNVQVIWQTGKGYAETAADAVKPFSGKGITTLPFISRMDLAYAAADIVISRSGAIAISELCAVAKPAILVPSPNVTEDHQTKNTLALTTRNAAIMVSDTEAPIKLINAVIDLASNPLRQEELKNNISILAHPAAADSIADAAIGLVKK